MARRIIGYGNEDSVVVTDVDERVRVTRGRRVVMGDAPSGRAMLLRWCSAASTARHGRAR